MVNQTKLNANIWKFAVHAITNKRAYMPFLTIFLLTMPNATAKTIGLLTLIGQITGFVFEIPSGYISDKIGHKKALILARVAMALSTLCYIFADKIWWFFLGSILLAIGWAFVSGTGNAFMHNTLMALGKDKQYAAIMGKIRSVGFAIPIIIIITLSTIAESSFKIAFVIAFIIDIIGLVTVLFMKNPPREKQTVKEIGPSNFSTVLREFISVGWLPFVLAGSIVLSIIFGATIGFKNPYQEMLGFSISALGILWAVSRVFISGLLLINGWIYRKLSFKGFLLLRVFIFGVSFIAIGFITNMWVVAVLFIMGNTAMWGFLSAESQYLLEFIKDSKFKATLLSVKELITKLFTAGVGIAMGLLVVKFSFQIAYLIVGIFLFLIMCVTAIFLPKHQKLKNI